MFKKWLAFSLALLVVAILIVAPVFASIPTTITYKDYEGNFSGAFKIEDYSTQTVYFDDSLQNVPGPTSKYVIFTVSDDTYVSFQATGMVVSQLYLKGGDGYRVYTFTPATDFAEKLQCPLNGGGNIPAISHYGGIKFEVPQETTTTQTTTNPTTTQPTTTNPTTTQPTTTVPTTTQPTITTTTGPTYTTSPTETTKPFIPETGEEQNIPLTLLGWALLIAAVPVGYMVKVMNRKA